MFVKRYTAVVFAGSICAWSGVRVQCGELSLLQSQQPALSHLFRSWPGESEPGMWHLPLHATQPYHLTCALEWLSHNHTRPSMPWVHTERSLGIFHKLIFLMISGSQESCERELMVNSEVMSRQLEILPFIVSQGTLCFVFHQLIGRMPVLQNTVALHYIVEVSVCLYVRMNRSCNCFKN